MSAQSVADLEVEHRREMQKMSQLLSILDANDLLRNDDVILDFDVNKSDIHVPTELNSIADNDEELNLKYLKSLSKSQVTALSKSQVTVEGAQPLDDQEFG